MKPPTGLRYGQERGNEGGKLVSLGWWGNSIVGKVYAQRILDALKSTTTTVSINASRSKLGPAGGDLLFRAFLSRHQNRARPGTTPTEGHPWAIEHVCVSGILTEILVPTLRFACEAQTLRDLTLYDNLTTFSDSEADEVAKLLNGSNLQSLNVSHNEFSSSAVSKLFDNLSSPTLRDLILKRCNLKDEVVPAIVRYLSSPRSRPLRKLHLTRNWFTEANVEAIIDCVTRHNFTLEQITLDSQVIPGIGLTNKERNELVARRLEPSLERNVALAKRPKRAAAKAIVLLRIILQGSPVKQGSRRSRRNDKRHFSLLALPREIQLMVARYASEDPAGLSDAQWLRLVAHASDRKTILARAHRIRMWNRRPRQAMLEEHVDEWLVETGCAWWDGVPCRDVVL